MIETFKDFIKEEKKFLIFVDMDGVLVDFQGGIEREGISFEAEEVLKFFETEKGNSFEFWRDLKALNDGKKLWKFLLSNNFKPEILSACPSKCKEEKNAVKGKIAWLKENLKFTDKKRIHITERRKKQNFANKNSILIDDLQKNIDEFNAAGGNGIFYKNSGQAIKDLKKIIN